MQATKITLRPAPRSALFEERIIPLTLGTAINLGGPGVRASSTSEYAVPAQCNSLFDQACVIGKHAIMFPMCGKVRTSPWNNSEMRRFVLPFHGQIVLAILDGYTLLNGAVPNRVEMLQLGNTLVSAHYMPAHRVFNLEICSSSASRLKGHLQS